MKINFNLIKIPNCALTSIVQTLLVGFILNSFNLVQTSNLIRLSDNFKNKSNQIASLPSSNCLSLASKFDNFVNFLDLKISFYDFQQIINLKSNDDFLYFGKRIVQENSVLALTCIKRPSNSTSNQIDWYLNASPLEALYSSNRTNKKLLFKSYQTKKYYCKNLNLVVYKLVIKKVDFLNQGEYQCIENLDVSKLNVNKFFVQMLFTDWDYFNSKFLNSIYYDILLSENQTLVKYCPLSTPLKWYKWATKLNFDNQSTIPIYEPGRYTCNSKLLNRKINFYIFGN